MVNLVPSVGQPLVKVERIDQPRGIPEYHQRRAARTRAAALRLVLRLAEIPYTLVVRAAELRLRPRPCAGRRAR